MPESDNESLQEFVDLLTELRGVLEVRVIKSSEEVWIGLRTGKQRPGQILLEQINKAASGFGLDTRVVHFGLLAD